MAAGSVVQSVGDAPSPYGADNCNNPLSTHALRVIIEDKNCDIQPTVQVLDVRAFTGANPNQKRIRLVVSDGVNMANAMLSTQAIEYFEEHGIEKGSVIKLLDLVCNQIQSRDIIVILALELKFKSHPSIGNPKQMNEGSPHMNAPAGPATTSVANSSIRPPSSTATEFSRPPNLSLPGSSTVNNTLPQQAVTSRFGNNPQNPLPGSSAAFEFKAGSGAATPSSPTVPRQFGGAELGGSNLTPAIGPLAGSFSATSNSNHYGKNSGSSGNILGSGGVGSVPAPSYTGRGPVLRNESAAKIIPIRMIQPYSNRWAIKGRVTSKSDLRRYHNAKGEGKLFSFDLLDGEGGEIRIAGFNREADEHFERVQVGRVYILSKGSIRPAQRNYNHLKCDWEITLDSNSTLEESAEDASIPHVTFSFAGIADIENKPNGEVLDVLGVVVSVAPTQTIVRKNGQETQKRSCMVRDQSGHQVELTLWGGMCFKEGQELQNCVDNNEFPVVAVKGARVNDFGGKCLSTISSSQVILNPPDLPEAQALRNWFDRGGGRTMKVQMLTREGAGGGRVEVRKVVSAIKDEGLGRGEKPDYICVRATVSFVKADNFCYMACPLRVSGDKQCNKKVVEDGSGYFYCERCGQKVKECDFRYILSLQVYDHTGSTWLTAFQETGEELMGVSARELFEWRREGDYRASDAFARLLHTQRVFRLKVREETYQDEQRVKSTLLKSELIDFSRENRILLEEISRIEKGLETDFSAGNADVSTGKGLNGGQYGPGGGRVSTGGAYAGATGGGGGYSGVNNSAYGTGGTSGGFNSGGYGSGRGMGGSSGQTTGDYPGGGPYGSGGFNGGGSGYSTPGKSEAGNQGRFGYGRGGSEYSSGVAFSGGGVRGYGVGGGGSGSGQQGGSKMAYGSSGGGNAYGSNSGSGGGGSLGVCFKCGKEGHFARDCPAVSGGPTGGGFNSGNSGYGNSGGYGTGTNQDSGVEGFRGGGGGGTDCYKCGQAGHWARDCPSGGGSGGGFRGGGRGGFY